MTGLSRRASALQGDKHKGRGWGHGWPTSTAWSEHWDLVEPYFWNHNFLVRNVREWERK